MPAKRKLTDQQIMEIRYMFIGGATQNEIAIRYNCARSYITQVCSGVHRKPKNELQKLLVDMCIEKNSNNYHKLSKTKIYSVWNSMLERCRNPRCEAYKNYGGRGIKVCKEWHDFRNFIKWVEVSEYKEGLDIDRINNDGNYEPANCRFTTRSINVRNKRNTKLTMEDARKIRSKYVFKSKHSNSYTLAKEFGISPSVVQSILKGDIWKEI